jgi:type III secretion protein V
MCLEFLKLHADLLVGDEQVDLYARGLGSTVDLNAVRPERLRAVMKTVVSLGVSLRDVETVRSVLAQATEAPAEDLAEAVVTALGAPAVELRFAPDLLRELLGIRADGTPFSAMREALFSELGVELPSLHLVEDAALPARTFSVKVNALEHLAWRALPPGQIMTNCPVERLRDFEVEASPWLNPQGQAPFAIASADAAATIQALGLMTWEPLEHVALCCLETLRTRAPALLSWPMLDRRLDLLRVTNPRLMEVVDGLSGSSSLLRACRALVAEQLSIEDLVPILELWLEHAVRDDHAAVPHTLIASIREGLARQIAVRFGFGPRTSTLVVYLVAPQLESAVRDAVSRLGHTDLPCTDLGEQLADAARAELAFLSPALLPPAILTSADIRGAIRRVVSYEFPRLAVLSYNELPPTLNVQPVARIGAG